MRIAAAILVAAASVTAGAAEPLITPTQPKPGTDAVIFFSGDWGWRPLQQEMASHLAREGRAVIGIDATTYFGRKLEPIDWTRDLKTLRTFVNGKAGLPADSPVLLIGFTFGGELIPYMLNRGGAEGFAGALMIGPDHEGQIIYRASVQLRLPSPPDETFDVGEELRRMKPIPVVLMEGALDTLSEARKLLESLTGPRKYVPVVGADRQFRQARETFFTLLSQAMAWLEGPHTPGQSTLAPEPEQAPETPPPVPDSAPR
jgi:Bacterial virulence protein (VirJ)